MKTINEKTIEALETYKGSYPFDVANPIEERIFCKAFMGGQVSMREDAMQWILQNWGQFRTAEDAAKKFLNDNK
ncbi:MAG: hypothetical protein MJY60_04035 [Bacteroidales bacterium]|nr:hypothetical protein [Bacteroidales bacterium]